MQQPLISILIPFKNTELFLGECLDSIINQTYSNWELLIIDDNSTDNSYSLVESYTKKNTRIKLFKNEGSGIINALKLAFSKSKGTYITRMDSDDIMPNIKLETLLKNLQQHGKRYIATGLVSYFSAEGISDGYRKYETWLNKLTSKGTNYSEIYKECVIPSPCWMISREDLLNIDAFNPTRYPEDYDLTFRFYQANYKIIPCNQTLHFWRDYGTRASRTDANYAENSFIDIKLYYFLKLDYNKKQPLVIWGAGNKGKAIAKKLNALNIPFYWICDNPKKIGKHIYNVEMKPFQYLETLKHFQCIVSVANNEEQQTIKAYFLKLNKKSMTDYFFFC
ncbi:glycosyltransferase involved in cell wall biosynthesis [Lacinutrix venerupis]|uniref:glycosyltransferase n=1 Tax=Lacinutrix venerupis TaxID=1486034 RepID=UPI000EAF565D|nr:glycosyltransferase [Lacinutrix venerupis]RLJ60922.1 glycosyltransferase involved in cell wall biosynthesis [Lacinutrix venerupis]